ncbi:MAG: 2Fe-2S iron-sulfur cluster-binding protein [Planctomycetota bacterium]
MSSGSTSARLELDGREIVLSTGESVLEALERSRVDVPSGCRSGTCKKCLIQSEGEVPPRAQAGLRPQLASRGFFLACQARPTTGAFRILNANGPTPVNTLVERCELIGSDVLRLFLRLEGRFEYRPGQYLDVLHPSGESRSYSIASLPVEGALELHVRRIPNGLVSGWLCQLDEGARVRVRGPFGQCFHIADDPRRKLLLVGAGTGLAPLLGIAKDALHQGHEGAIDLIHGGVEPKRLYLRDELQALADRWPQLRIHYCVLKNATSREHQGTLEDAAVRLAGSLESVRAFLCGDSSIVQRLQRSLFLAGVPSAEIFADPFSPGSSSSIRVT